MDENTKGPAEEVGQKGPAEPTPWRSHFNERQLKEIDFCQTYAANFAHGATNHNVMMIVSQMADLLDKATGYDARALAKKIADAMVKGI